jgi:hypothetical protein
LKKRTKKLLFPGAVDWVLAKHQRTKVFCFFSSEKKTFLSSFVLPDAVF